MATASRFESGDGQAIEVDAVSVRPDAVEAGPAHRTAQYGPAHRTRGY